MIQHTFVNQDHFAVAASKDSFVRVYQYLNGKDPQYTEVQCGDDPVSIAGLSETFADNEPVLGKIEIREVSDVPRAAATADQTLMPDMHGQFSAQLKRNVYYEFAGYDANNTLVGYQYFTPFKRSNLLVRMLSPANKNDGSRHWRDDRCTRSEHRQGHAHGRRGDPGGTLVGRRPSSVKIWVPA